MATKAITANITGGQATKKALKHIEQQLGKATTVTVGFLADAKYPATYTTRLKFRPSPERSTTSIAQVAFWNEFGTKKSPARPAMRTTVSRYSAKWGPEMARSLKRFKYDTLRALTHVGEGIQGQMIHVYTQWSSPPNAPFTVKVKGFNKPLTDEGIMIKHIDYQVLTSDKS